jgi:hypothetical protein
MVKDLKKYLNDKRGSRTAHPAAVAPPRRTRHRHRLQ